MQLCEYGCGQKAQFQFKNGKWCCSKNISGCKKINQKQKISNQGKRFSAQRKNNISKSLLGRKRSKETKEKLRQVNTGKLNPNYGRKHTKETKTKISLTHKLTIEKINCRYPLFSRIEEMRYNPDKPGEIQVHCKNHNCLNSKEKGGWFTPTRYQLYERIRQIEKEYGNGGSYFYCSKRCKRECPLYYLKSDPYQKIDKPYTQQEYKIWKQTVLEHDNYQCQICGSKEKIHCHHIQPVKLFPQLALDPENGIVLCHLCHFKYGHADECSTGNLAKRNCYNSI